MELPTKPEVLCSNCQLWEPVPNTPVCIRCVKCRDQFCKNMAFNWSGFCEKCFNHHYPTTTPVSKRNPNECWVNGCRSVETKQIGKFLRLCSKHESVKEQTCRKCKKEKHPIDFKCCKSCKESKSKLSPKGEKKVKTCYMAGCNCKEVKCVEGAWLCVEHEKVTEHKCKEKECEEKIPVKLRFCKAHFKPKEGGKTTFRKSKANRKDI